MPRAPSKLRILADAEDDLAAIKQGDPDGAQRCFDAITDWERKIQWGRVPQEHLTYLTGTGPYNFYREWVGRSKYRVVYELSNDRMTAVAVFPKDDHAEFQRRMERS